MKLVTDFVLVSGMLTVLLMIYLLFRSRRRELPHLLLIAIFGFAFIVILNFYADLHEVKSLFYITLLFEDGSRFALGPLLYLYIRSLFVAPQRFLIKNAPHFVVYILFMIVITLPVVLRAYEDRFDFGYLEVLQWTRNFTFFKDLFLLTYLMVSMQSFVNLSQKMKWNYSAFTEKNFGWVRQMLRCALLVVALDILILIYELFYDSFEWDTGYITTVALVFVLVYLGYYGIRQTKVFLPEFLILNGKKPNLDKNGKSPLINLSPDEIEVLKTQLKRLMDKEMLFLDPDLTLGSLASKMGLSEKVLSALINQKMGTTFYDFINSYRISEVKKKIGSPDFENYTLLGIAYESGFNSKSSFYRVFKKSVDVSPAVYKRRGRTLNRS